MNRRPLTILLTAIFAAQAAGLTETLHLLAEHCQCDGHHHAGDDNVVAKSTTSVEPDGGRHKEAHDPAHCGICQALAAFKPLHFAKSLLAIYPEPLQIVSPSADHSRPSSTHISVLGPRAPPSSHLHTSV